MDDETIRLTKAMMTFGLAFTRTMHEALAEEAVSHARLRLLGALACDGPQIMAALSTSLQITPRAVTKLVDSLEAEKLVRRADHPTDRRATVVHATVEGRRLGERLTGRQLERVGRVFDLLNREQRRALLSTLESMNASIAGPR